MKLYLLIIGIFLASVTHSHDINYVLFNINDNGDHLALEITFDREDLTNRLPSINGASEIEFFDILTFYLSDDNMRWWVNAIKLEICFSSINIEGHEIKVLAQIKKPEMPIKRLEIWSTVIIDSDPYYKNVIQSQLNEQTRSFSITSKRPKVIIDYN